MIKITGLTKEDIEEVITKVAKNHRDKAFSYYSEYDIEQEVWVIALEKIRDFDVKKIKNNKDLKKGLESWLNTIVRNALINFYRDRYIVPQKSREGKKLGGTLLPFSIDAYPEESFQGKDPFFKNLDNDLLEYLVNNLDFSELNILECIINGEIINSYYRNKLLKKIRSILNEMK